VHAAVSLHAFIVLDMEWICLDLGSRTLDEKCEYMEYDRGLVSHAPDQFGAGHCTYTLLPKGNYRKMG